MSRVGSGIQNRLQQFIINHDINVRMSVESNSNVQKRKPNFVLIFVKKKKGKLNKPKRV